MLQVWLWGKETTIFEQIKTDKIELKEKKHYFPGEFSVLGAYNEKVFKVIMSINKESMKITHHAFPFPCSLQLIHVKIAHTM